MKFKIKSEEKENELELFLDTDGDERVALKAKHGHSERTIMYFEDGCFVRMTAVNIHCLAMDDNGKILEKKEDEGDCETPWS